MKTRKKREKKKEKKRRKKGRMGKKERKKRDLDDWGVVVLGGDAQLGCHIRVPTDGLALDLREWCLRTH